jgi:hypothetical protein
MLKNPSSTSSSDGVARFIVRLAAFGILLGTAIGLAFLTKLRIESGALASFPAEQILIVGDSHARAGLDPAALGGAVSAAQDAEPYVVTYHKLGRLLRAWRHVRTVVLSYSPHNLSAFNDRKFRSADYAREMFDRYGSLLAPKSLTGLEVDWAQYWRSYLFRTLLLKPRDVAALSWRGEVPYVGRFRAKTGSQLGDRRLERSIQRHFYDGDEETRVSLSAERHLWRIGNLSAERKIELFLVATPLHGAYRARIPAEFWRRYRRLGEVLSRARHVAFVDLSDLELAPHLYYDHDHVNQEGVKEVSARLAPLVTHAVLR